MTSWTTAKAEHPESGLDTATGAIKSKEHHASSDHCMPYLCIIRDSNLVVDAGSHDDEQVAEVMRGVLNLKEGTGWGSFRTWSHRNPYRGLRFHMYKQDGNHIRCFIFACAYNSKVLRKKSAQSFLERIAVTVQALADVDDSWKEGNEEQRQIAFSSIFLEWMENAAASGHDDSLELSRQIIKQNCELMNCQHDAEAAFEEEDEEEESVSSHEEAGVHVEKEAPQEEVDATIIMNDSYDSHDPKDADSREIEYNSSAVESTEVDSLHDEEATHYESASTSLEEEKLDEVLYHVDQLVKDKDSHGQFWFDAFAFSDEDDGGADELVALVEQVAKGLLRPEDAIMQMNVLYS